MRTPFIKIVESTISNINEIMLNITVIMLNVLILKKEGSILLKWAVLASGVTLTL